MDSSDDEMLVNNQTWNKIHVTATKSGYRDGISDGEKSNFQKSFDDGFCEGFKNGFILGLYKAALSSHNTENEILQKSSRGNCVLCKDESFEEKSISELIQMQNYNMKEIISYLHNKHLLDISINLPQIN